MLVGSVVTSHLCMCNRKDLATCFNIHAHHLSVIFVCEEPPRCSEMNKRISCYRDHRTKTGKSSKQQLLTHQWFGSQSLSIVEESNRALLPSKNGVWDWRGNRGSFLAWLCHHSERHQRLHETRYRGHVIYQYVLIMC